MNTAVWAGIAFFVVLTIHSLSGAMLIKSYLAPLCRYRGELVTLSLLIGVSLVQGERREYIHKLAVDNKPTVVFSNVHWT